MSTSPTILLIEDDSVLCEMYRLKFLVAGIQLAVAAGGYAGLDQAKKAHPELILLDLKMDDLDGFEVLKRLKADPALATIPVFLLTNMGEKDNADEGRRLGAEEYILKSRTLPQDIVNRVTVRLGIPNPKPA